MRAVLWLLGGVAAWLGVALLSVLITFNMGDKNQMLMFLPILVAVVGRLGDRRGSDRASVRGRTRRSVRWRYINRAFQKKGAARPGLHPDDLQ